MARWALREIGGVACRGSWSVSFLVGPDAEGSTDITKVWLVLVCCLENLGEILALVALTTAFAGSALTRVSLKTLLRSASLALDISENLYTRGTSKRLNLCCILAI